MPYSVKRFRFRLQPLLNIEQNREKQAQRTFQRALAECRREQELLAQQEQEFAQEQQALARAIQPGATPQLLRAYELFFFGLKARMAVQRQRSAAAEQAAETARQELAARTKQRKVLEKLKEKALAAYQEEVRRIEMGLLDEVGTCRRGPSPKA